MHTGVGENPYVPEFLIVVAHGKASDVFDLDFRIHLQVWGY
jgi:hypothetical protein